MPTWRGKVSISPMIASWRVHGSAGTALSGPRLLRTSASTRNTILWMQKTATHSLARESRRSSRKPLPRTLLMLLLPLSLSQLPKLLLPLMLSQARLPPRPGSVRLTSRLLARTLPLLRVVWVSPRSISLPRRARASSPSRILTWRPRNRPRRSLPRLRRRWKRRKRLNIALPCQREPWRWSRSRDQSQPQTS